MQDPLAYLFALEQFGIKFGLGNIEAILDALGHPERAYRTVHVAGTNGKGSVTAMVDTALRAAGHRSARYTSPHLLRINERFVVDGTPVSDAELVDAAAQVVDVIERLRTSGTLEVLPTFFEATTALAFELFRRQDAAVAVVEVGLGGRLDATNVIAPIAAAITSIGFDHENYLGRTLRAIAGEKAGILKPGVPAVIGDVPDEAFDAIAAAGARAGAPIVRAHAGVSVRALDDASGRVAIRTPSADYGAVTLALPGAHQIDNAIVAVRLLETIASAGVPVANDAIVRGLSDVKWPGRLEMRSFPDGRRALLDAAHNPDGAAALASYLVGAGLAPAPIVIAAMADKDTAGIFRALGRAASRFVLTRASTPRAATPEALAAAARQAAPHVPIDIEPSLASALASAWTVSPTIVVAGSIFLLADVYRQWGGPTAS